MEQSSRDNVTLTRELILDADEDASLAQLDRNITAKENRLNVLVALVPKCYADILISNEWKRQNETCHRASMLNSRVDGYVERAEDSNTNAQKRRVLLERAHNVNKTIYMPALQTCQKWQDKVADKTNACNAIRNERDELVREIPKEKALSQELHTQDAVRNGNLVELGYKAGNSTKAYQDAIRKADQEGETLRDRQSKYNAKLQVINDYLYCPAQAVMRYLRRSIPVMFL
ncbi:MAG: hypothetical protein ABW189_02370 [Rickettsiales bacterium]